MKRVSTGLMVMSAVALPALAQPHGGDIVLRVENSRIVTGLLSGTTYTPTRVFESELGEFFPDTTDEPGFDSAPFTFTPGTAVGFRIHDVLRRWNGTDFSTQAVPPMEVSFLSLSTRTPATPGVVTGFTLPVSSNGQWHRHLDYTLLPPATIGVYALKLTLFSTGPQLESLPFWIIFNQETDPAIFEAAADWARDNLPGGPPCNDIDFNNDGLLPDTLDIDDFVSVFGGGACSTGACDSVDFNNDGLFPDTDDLEAMLRVFAGGEC